MSNRNDYEKLLEAALFGVLEVYGFPDHNEFTQAFMLCNLMKDFKMEIPEYVHKFTSKLPVEQMCTEYDMNKISLFFRGYQSLLQVHNLTYLVGGDDVLHQYICDFLTDLMDNIIRESEFEYILTESSSDASS